jgi:hypothetical protein
VLASAAVAAPSDVFRQIGLASEHVLQPDSERLLGDDAAFAPPVPGWARGSGGPADHELLQLRAGLRRLVKRERSSLALAERTARELRERGFAAQPFAGPAGQGGSRARFIAFASLDAGAVEEAMELEGAMLAPPRQRRPVVERFGALLGYPTCCAARLAAEERQDDGAQVARLAADQRGALSLFDNWAPVELRPFSHFPCEPGCARTADLARATMELIAAERPSYASALRRALASAALVQEIDRFALLLDARVDGASARYGGVLSHRNMAVAVRDAALARPAFRAFYLEVIAALELGDRVTREPRALVVERAGRSIRRVEFAEQAPALLDFTAPPRVP